MTGIVTVIACFTILVFGGHLTAEQNSRLTIKTMYQIYRKTGIKYVMDLLP